MKRKIMFNITTFLLVSSINITFADVPPVWDEDHIDVRIKSEEEILSHEDISDILQDEYYSKRNTDVGDIILNKVEPVYKKTLPSTKDSQTEQNNLTGKRTNQNVPKGEGSEALYNLLKDAGIEYGSKADILTQPTMAQWQPVVEKIISEQPEPCAYDIPTNFILAMIQQESSGDPNCAAAAVGLMQIQTENSTVQDFINCGKNVYNETWGSNDRYDPEKNIKYGVHRMVQALNKYEGDYLKALQEHNYGPGALKKLLNKYGEDWINNRSKMAGLMGKSSYGDSKYLEHVLQYFS